VSLSRRAATSAALDVSPLAPAVPAIDASGSDVPTHDVSAHDAGSSTELSLFAPVLRPIRSGNAFEETVERLLHTIKLGVVRPGERLPAERDLANRLRVSRETLREAIGSLREAGYLESRRGRSGGTFVVTDSVPDARSRRLKPSAAARNDLEDALAFRLAVESGAAQSAARRSLRAGERARLLRLQNACFEAPLGSYRPADSRLHLAIAELSGSPSLASAVADARVRVNDLLDAIPLLPRNIVHSNQQHATIVQAVLAGDPRAARDAMAEHLDGTAALLRAFLA
jgi:DNA-binding FadR family transcriptional regulator